MRKMSASSSAGAVMKLGSGQSIQRADGRTYRQVGNVQIPGRSLQVTMPHQNLDAAKICRLFQQMGGEAMPQGVRRYRFDQLRGGARLLADAPDRDLRNRALRALSREEPGHWSVLFPVELQHL